MPGLPAEQRGEPIGLMQEIGGLCAAALLRQPEKLGETGGGGANSMSFGCDGFELRGLLTRTVVMVEQGGMERLKFRITQHHRAGSTVYRQAVQAGGNIFRQCAYQCMQRAAPIQRSLRCSIGISRALLPDDGFGFVYDTGARAGGAEIQAEV